jgi:hypothetical protein
MTPAGQQLSESRDVEGALGLPPRSTALSLVNGTRSPGFTPSRVASPAALRQCPPAGFSNPGQTLPRLFCLFLCIIGRTLGFTGATLGGVDGERPMTSAHLIRI